MAHSHVGAEREAAAAVAKTLLIRTLIRERATGIEPAFSAWEAERRVFRDLLESAKVLVRGYVGCPPVTAETAP